MEISGFYTVEGIITELRVAKNLGFENVHISRQNYMKLLSYIEDITIENDNLKDDYKTIRDEIVSLHNLILGMEITKDEDIEEI